MCESIRKEVQVLHVNPLLTRCIVVLSLVGWLGGFSLPLAALAVGGVSLVQPQHGLVHT